MSENKFKLKESSTEWALQSIINNYTDEPGCEKIVQFAKVACVTPVTNAWPERGASAVKRIKSRISSTMKNDLLNGLMHISINGLKANSSETGKMIEKACLKFQQTRQNKMPNVFVVRTTVKVASTQTVEVQDKA